MKDSKAADIQRKVNVALIRLEQMDEEYRALTAQVAPINAKREKIASEMSYLKARIDKLTQILKGA